MEIEVWVAKDRSMLLGSRTVCLFKHEPSLRDGYFGCRVGANRVPVGDLGSWGWLKPGEKRKIKIVIDE